MSEEVTPVNPELLEDIEGLVEKYGRDMVFSEVLGISRQKRNLTPEARDRIRVAQKRRWAAARERSPDGKPKRSNKPVVSQL